MGRLVDLTGARYGYLTVVKRYGSKNGHATWECKCDCGKVTIVRGNDLKNGAVLSCGCKRAEVCGNTHRTHGHCKTRLHTIWQHMRQRCNNKNNPRYKYYGGRGITICDEWNRYERFEEWALSHGYQDDLTIDRIDVNGDYCPDNCRWVTWKAQQNNRRNNVIITAFGETRTLTEWEEISGVNRTTIQKRIKGGGKTPEEAMGK